MTDVAVIPEAGLLETHDRLVVSRVHGRAIITAPSFFTAEGEVVREGDVLARIKADSSTVDIHAPCDAWVLAFLVTDGERVEPGSALAHLRAL